MRLLKYAVIVVTVPMVALNPLVKAYVLTGVMLGPLKEG